MCEAAARGRGDDRLPVGFEKPVIGVESFRTLSPPSPVTMRTFLLMRYGQYTPSAEMEQNDCFRRSNSDVVIIGAGAAGLMCAIESARRGRRTLVVEHNARPGRKILISGGGRCNFTNIDTRPENFLSANPHFAKSALARYTPRDFVRLVERHGIRYHEKKLGQLPLRWPQPRKL